MVKMAILFVLRTHACLYSTALFFESLAVIMTHSYSSSPLPSVLSERLFNPTPTLEMHLPTQSPRQSVTTVTLAVSISVAVVCTVLFVMTAAAVIVCAKKKGLYTSRRSDVLYDEPSLIILNERYQSTTD